MTSFKETVVEETLLKPTREMTIADTARDMGSSLAHQVLDGVGQMVAIIPDGLDEIDRIASAGEKFLPECFQDHNDNPLITGNRTENFEKTLAQGHQAIDQIFATDQAPLYTQEAKEKKEQFVVGFLPIPGMFSNAKQLAEAGKAIDRAGFTRAGRGLMKHGYREDSVFPKPVGNPAQVNEHGQAILEEILNDPNKKVYQLPNGNLKVFSSNGRGAHFKNDNTFVGFIEEQYEKEINN